MANNFNFVTQGLEFFFDPSWIIREKTGLMINQDIDLDSLSNPFFYEVK